jgi:hypothetical protein
LTKTGFLQGEIMSKEIVTTRIHWLFFCTMRIVAIIAFCIAVVCLLLGILQPRSDTWVGFFLFGFFGATAWFVVSTYFEISNQYVLINTFYGRFRINWDEVKYIETNGHLYAFIGEDKRVVIVTPLMASSKMKELNDFIMQQTEERNIEVRQTNLVPTTHKNACVKIIP